MEKNEVNEFDTYGYGNTEDSISFFGAVIHVMKYTIGYGVLIIPSVFKNLGYVVATALTVFVAFLYYHIIHMMFDIEHQLRSITRKSKFTFMEVINEGFEHVSSPLRVIFGPIIKILLHLVFLVPTGNAVTLILMSNMLKNTLEYWSSEINFMQAINIVFVPSMLLSVCAKKLNIMVPFSALTNIFTLVIMGIVIVYPFFSSQSKSSPKPINDISTLPQNFGLMIDIFSATSIFMTVKNEMRTPQAFSKFFGVLNVSGLLLFVLFSSFGMVGYWNYGEEVDVNVLNNIPQDNILSFSINILFLPNLVVHYYLSIYVRYDIYRESLPKILDVKTNAQELLIEYSMKIFFNIVSYLFAICIPNFELFATIIGTVDVLVDVGILPLLQFCLMVTFWPGWKCMTFIKMGKNIAIISITLVIFLSSAKACLKALINE